LRPQLLAFIETVPSTKKPRGLAGLGVLIVSCNRNGPLPPGGGRKKQAQVGKEQVRHGQNRQRTRIQLL